MSDIVYGFQPIDIKELSSFNKPEWKYAKMIWSYCFQLLNIAEITISNFNSYFPGLDSDS